MKRKIIIAAVVLLSVRGVAEASQAITHDFAKLQQDTTKSKKSRKNIEIVSKNGAKKGSFTYINNGIREEIKYEGTFTFTDDFRDIKTVTPGGYLRYGKKANGEERKLEIESDKNGNLTRKYYENGKAVAYEPAGRQWMQQEMPGIITKTGIGLEAMVQDVYKKRGAKGVLAEADKVESNTNKLKVVRHLLQQPNLPVADTKLALQYAANNKGSDYEVSTLLRQVPTSLLAKEEIASAYLQATQKISSDYEKRKVLSQLLSNAELSSSSTRMAVEALSSISSDYEKSKVVQQLAEQKNFLTDNYKVTFDVIGSFSSDYEKSKSINSILNTQKLSEPQYQALFPVVTSIGSDYEKSKVLRNMAPRIPESATALRNDYKKAAKTINSDHEYRKAIEALE